MPFIIEHLLEGRPEPVTALVDEKVQDAIKRMVEHNFSQLPVVNHDGKPIGMLTSDSILRALNNFGATPDALHVNDAMVQIEDKQKFRADEDLFTLLDHFRDTYAVAVIDRTDRLIGVVTTYDTTEYLRRRAEDMMLVREIEKLIKDYILESFRDSDGQLDDAVVTAAIEQITPSNKDLQKRFAKALTYYLEKQTGSKAAIKGALLEDAFTQHLDVKQNPKEFDELMFNEYISLLLSDSRWTRYNNIFQIEKSLLLKLLEAVRDTRNDLAHLREDITPQQRDELQFCAKWLARHEKALLESFRSHQVSSPVQPVDEVGTANPNVEEGVTELQTSSPEDAIGPRESRYAPLALFLQQVPLYHTQITLSFNDIEDIIEDKLPESARRLRAWWANDAQSHVQSQEWLNVGWRVATINMTEERVSFARIEGRQRAYIDFYSSLLTMLRQARTIPIWNTNPDGANWIGIATLRNEGTLIAGFNFAFTRTRQFRIELYIDSGSQEQNKQLFDALFERRELIEQDLGQPLSWERLPEKRASRVAVYHDVFITANDAELAALRAWIVEMTPRFHGVMWSHVKTFMPEVTAWPEA